MEKNHEFRYWDSHTWKKTVRVMKLTFILMFAALFSVSARGFGQGASLSLKMEDASLKEVLTELKNSTSFSYVYNEEAIAEVDEVNISAENASVQEILEECLYNTELTYHMENNVIIIHKRPYEEMVSTVKQEKYEITGTVIDDQKIPLPGVSVVVKGTNIGTATDIDGNYVLKVDEKPAALIFTFVGMNQQEVAYKGQKVINVTLSADTESLGEVVVTGYSAIKKERATGSFVNISEEKLQEVHHENLTEKLQATAPGLLMTRQIGADGEDDLTIQMRGAATLKGNSKPLVVVDGFPTEIKVKDINVDDIKTINILQDAAAASIWGARAANGVIVIQTKRGRSSEKVNVSFGYDLTIETKPDMDRLQIAKPEDVIAHTKFIWDNNAHYSIARHKRGGTNEIHLNPLYRILDKRDKDANYTAAMADADLLKVANTSNLGTYSDLFLRTGITHNYNANISGGTDKIKYYASFSHRDKKMTSVGDKKVRDVITLNTDYKLHKRVTLSVGFTHNQTNADRNGLGLAGIMGDLGREFSLYDKFLNEDGTYAKNYSFTGKPGSQYEQWEKEGHLAEYKNPYQSMKEKDFSSKSKITRYNIGLKFDILKGLNLDVKGYYESNNLTTKDYVAPGTLRANANLNNYTKLGQKKSILEEGSEMTRYYSESVNKSLRSQLNYNKEFKDHKFNAILGFEMRENKGESNQFYHLDYNDKTGVYRINHFAETKSFKNYKDEWTRFSPQDFVTFHHSRFMSYYTNMAYTFKNRYTLTASARIDDGSMFGVDANKRRTPLWSVGTSWNISSEPWFNNEVVNMLKARLTYGKNGIVNNKFSSFTTLKFRNSLGWKFNLPNASVGNYYNPDLKWETTATTNFALDFSMLDGRLSGKVEMYNKLSSDVLSDTETNPISGATKMTINNAEIRNRGYEITLNAVIGNKFQWMPGISLAYNKNEVLKAKALPSDADDYIRQTRYGQPAKGYSVAEVFRFKFAGLDNTGDIMVYDENNVARKTTDPKVTNLGAVHSIGVLTPKYWGAFTNGFRYKNFSLNTTILYKFGHIFEGPNQVNGIAGIYHKNIANAWHKPGDEKTKTIPRAFTTYNRTRGAYGYNDSNWYKADHIRLQDISLSYDLPKKFIERYNLTGARIRLQVSNLGILWAANDLDLDPERVPFSWGGNSITQMQNEAPVTYRPNIGQEPIYNLSVKLNF